MLYVIGTPIGHLKDMTFRAVETLHTSDYILCEDTRVSVKLLNHYGIKKPLRSLHKFNEALSLEKIIKDLKEGLQLSLISDGGTPCISDPGGRLIERCIESGIRCTPIPGPSAITTALSVSGFLYESFQFLGFLPKGRSKKRKALQGILEYPGLSVCYESPYRVKETLVEMTKLDPDCTVFLARELTKVFETLLKHTSSELLQEVTEHPLKGECTLIFQKGKTTPSTKIPQKKGRGKKELSISSPRSR